MFRTGLPARQSVLTTRIFPCTDPRLTEVSLAKFMVRRVSHAAAVPSWP
jgi:hypothetical protein